MRHRSESIGLLIKMAQFNKASVSCGKCGFVHSKTLTNEPNINEYRRIWNDGVKIDSQIDAALMKALSYFANY